MRPTDPLPRPSLRRQIEQTLAASPRGLDTRMLRHVLDARAKALGAPPIRTSQLIRQLGLLLLDGRIDERDGIWNLCRAGVRAERAA